MDQIQIRNLRFVDPNLGQGERITFLSQERSGDRPSARPYIDVQVN